MENEQKCENGPTSVQDLNSRATLVSRASPSARGNNRSIRAVVETVQERPERTAISDLYACSSNSPNSHDEHNSPSPPINEAGLECTKCEPAGVHEKKCGIFQQTGSALVNDCSVFVNLVDVRESSLGKPCEVICHSVRTDESVDVATDDGNGYKYVRNTSILNIQDSFSDNSEYAALRTSFGNSESIFRSDVINQILYSKGEVDSKYIPKRGDAFGESKRRRSGEEQTSSAELLGNGYERDICDSNCSEKVKPGHHCGCCKCQVSSGLSDLTVKSDHQKPACSTGHTCQVDGLCADGLPPRPGLNPCLILSSSDSGTESSERVTQTCKTAARSTQCNCTSTKDGKNDYQQISFSHVDNDFIREENAYSVAFETSTSFPTTLFEVGRSDNSTAARGSTKRYEGQDCVSTSCSSRQCLVERCSDGKLNHCCVCSQDDVSVEFLTLNKCVNLDTTRTPEIHKGAFEQILDDADTHVCCLEVDKTVESIDGLKIQRESKEGWEFEHEDKGSVLSKLHIDSPVGCNNEKSTVHGNTPDRTDQTNGGKSLELVSSIHGGKGQSSLPAERELITPVLNSSDADSLSGNNIVQTNNRIEVSPGVRKSLIQISKSLQKNRSRIRRVNDVKAVTQKKATDARSKSFGEAGKYSSSSTKEKSTNTRVKCCRQKKLNNSPPGLGLTNSCCHVSQTGIKNTSESGVVLLTSTPSGFCASHCKCKSHVADNKSGSRACRPADNKSSSLACRPADNKSSSLTCRPAINKSSSLACRPADCICPGNIHSGQGHGGANTHERAGSKEQRSNVLIGQKRKIVVRQTRASILRCTGQQQKASDTTGVTDDIQGSVQDESTTTELNNTTWVRGSPASRGKSSAYRTPNSSTNVKRLRTPKLSVSDRDRGMANVSTINKRQTLVKCQKGQEMEAAIKVKKVEKISTVGIGHGAGKANMAEAHVTLKAGSHAAVKTCVAKGSFQHSRSQTTTANRQLDSARKVQARVEVLHPEKKNTIDNKCNGKKREKDVTSAIPPVSRKLLAQKTTADKSLARIRAPTAAPGIESSSSASLITAESPSTRKKLTSSGVSSSAQAQPPLLSPAEGANVTTQCNTASLVVPATLNDRCKKAVTVDMGDQLCTVSPSSLKRIVASAHVSNKPVISQSLQGTAQRQSSYSSRNMKSIKSSGRPQSSIQSSVSIGMKSTVGLSLERKQSSKETSLPSSSIPSTQKSPTLRQSKNTTPLAQSAQNRPPSNLLETTIHPRDGQRERKLANIKYKCSKSNGASISKQVLPATETARTDQCQTKVADAVHCAESSRDHSIICNVHDSNSLTQQHNTVTSGNIPLYSKELIKDAGKYDTHADRKESVLKSILINTSDHRLNGEADLLAVPFHKPMKVEDENTSQHLGEDNGVGQETYSCPDRINSFNIEYKNGDEICGGALAITELHNQEVLKVIKTDNMTGDSGPTENKAREASGVTTGNSVPILGKTREMVAVNSKKTVKEYENIQVRKQTPNIAMKQRKISPLFGRQVNNFKEDAVPVSKVELSKNTSIGYSMNGRKNKYSILSADQMNHSQTAQTRIRLVKTVVPQLMKTDQTTCVKDVLESSTKPRKTAPKQTPVTRTQPGVKSTPNERKTPAKSRPRVKPLTSALETSAGSCSESTPSVLSELPSSSSSSSLSFSSCGQTTPERESGKPPLLTCATTTVEPGNESKACHITGSEMRPPATKTLVPPGVVSVSKSMRPPARINDSKTPYRNIGAIKGAENKNSATIKYQTGIGERGTTQIRSLKKLEHVKMEKIKRESETEMEILIRNKAIEIKRNKQSVDDPVVSKSPVFNDYKMRDSCEDSPESATKEIDSVLLRMKRNSVSDRDREEADIRENIIMNIQEVQLMTDKIGSNLSVAVENGVDGLRPANVCIGLQDLHLCESRENHKLLDAIYLQPPAVTANNSTPDLFSSLTSSRVPCLAATGVQVQTLHPVPLIDQADRSQIAAECSKSKQGVSRDTPIEGESARELNASDVDCRERARSGSAQRKEAGSEEKEKKVEETQTTISSKPTPQGSCLQCILPSAFRYCDNCKCALYPFPGLKSSSANTNTIEITKQPLRNVSTKGIHSHKEIGEFRCFHITQNMSSVSELHFQPARNEREYEFLMDNSTEEIPSNMCCHCISTQKATETMTTSVPGVVRNGDTRSVFGISAQDQEEHTEATSCDSQSNMRVRLACDVKLTELDTGRKRYKREIKQNIINVEACSSVDEVSGHVNGIDNVADNFVQRGPISNTSVSAHSSDKVGDAHTKSVQISEPLHRCRLEDPIIVSTLSNVNCDKNEDVMNDNDIANDAFESDNCTSVSIDLSAHSCDSQFSIPNHHSTPYCLSGSLSEVGHDVLECDVVKDMKDVSINTLNDDTVTSMLNTDVSIYATPVGHSFYQDNRGEAVQLGSVCNKVDDSDIPEYFDDSDDKNDTESSGSSDSSYQSATSDILTTTESTPERELAYTQECEISAASNELNTCITLASKCVPADRFLDATFTSFEQYDSCKQEFNSESFILDPVTSDNKSATSKPNGFNHVQQNSEESPTRRSQFSDVATTSASCSHDASLVSQRINTLSPMSRCGETVARVGLHVQEVDIYQNKDVFLKENIAQLTSITKKWSELQEPVDNSLQRNASREHRSDPCSRPEHVSQVCDIPVAKDDLLSSLSYVDNSSTDLPYGDIAPGTNKVYACSNAASFPEFSSLAFSSFPQKAAEKRYRQRNNSEDKIPSFLSVRSLSVERKKSGRTKSTSLPRSRSSFTVTSSTVTSSSVSLSAVTSSTVTSSTVTSSTMTSSTMSSPTATSSTVPSSNVTASTIASLTVVSSTEASSTATFPITTTFTMSSSTVVSSIVASSSMPSSAVTNSYLCEPQFLSHSQQQQHRQASPISQCHQSVCTQVPHSELQEPTTGRQLNKRSYIAVHEDMLIPEASESNIQVNNKQLTSTDTDTPATNVKGRTSGTTEKQPPEKGEIVDGNEHVNTLTSHNPKMQLGTSSNLKVTASRPTSICKSKGKKFKPAGESSNKVNTSQSCGKSYEQGQHIQQCKCANEPDNVTSYKLDFNTNSSETCRKSGEQGKHVKQPKLTSHEHTDSTSSHKQAAATAPQAYLTAEMEHPLTRMETGYNFSNNPDSAVSEDTLPVSECTSTEFSLHTSPEALAFKTSLFESGYSSDIKSPEVKSPGKEFVNNHRQAVSGNHRQSVQTVPDNVILNAEKGNKITISDSLSPGADLKRSMQSNTRETTLFDNTTETTCKHSLEDLSPLSKKAGENVEKLGSEIARGGKISHFISEQYGKIGEGDAGMNISRGGYLGNIPHELSTLCRDNLYMLGKSVPEVKNTHNLAPVLDSAHSISNSCPHADFPLGLSIIKPVTDVSSTYHKQHTELAHNDSFVDARTQLQKHATPSTNAFSDTIAMSERLKIDMPNEYKHTSTRRDTSNLANVNSRPDAREPNLISSKLLTENQKELGSVDQEVTKCVDFNHLCSGYFRCECTITNCNIHERQQCTCGYTQHVSAHMSIKTPANLDQDNDRVYSYVTPSQQRTSGAQVSETFENFYTDVIQDSSINSELESNSFTDVSADHDKSNSCTCVSADQDRLNSCRETTVNHNMDAERDSECNTVLSNTFSTVGTRKCAYKDCVHSENDVGVTQGVQVNRDSLTDFHTSGCRDTAGSSSVNSGFSDVINSNVPVGNSGGKGVRSLELRVSQSTALDSKENASKCDDDKHGELFQNELCFIRNQTHLPHRRSPLSSSLSLRENQELVETASMVDTKTVSYNILPSPTEKHNEETTQSNSPEPNSVSHPGSCLTSRTIQGQQGTLAPDMSKKTDSPGNFSGRVPYVLCDVISGDSDDVRQQTVDNLHDTFDKETIQHRYADTHMTADKKQTSLSRVNENIGICKNYVKNSHDGKTEHKTTSASISQDDSNITILLVGQSQGSAAGRLSLPPADVEPRSRHDNSGSQTSRRRSPTNRHEGLPKETSPFILEKVCELLSKASAIEQRDFIRPKSPLPHNDTSRVALSKNRPLTPNRVARAREKRVIKKWKSMVEKSKASRKEKSITMTFLNLSDNMSTLPSQISPTSLKKYKWEREDSGIWKKVYISDEDNKDSQVIQYIDSEKQPCRLDSQHEFMNDLIAFRSSVFSVNTSNAYDNKQTTQEIQVTVTEKSDAPKSPSSRDTQYSTIHLSQQSNDHKLQFPEQLSNSEYMHNLAQETMRLSSARSRKSEGQKKPKHELAKQKLEDVLFLTDKVIIENKKAPLLSTLYGVQKNDLEAFASDAKVTTNISDTETTKLLQHAGSLHPQEDGRLHTTPVMEASDDFKSAEKLERKTRKYIWPTVAESLKRFQKSRAVVPSWGHFKRGQGTGLLDPPEKHVTCNKENDNFREEEIHVKSDISFGNESNCKLVTDVDGNRIKSERNSLVSNTQPHIARDDKTSSLVSNISSSMLKESSSSLPDSKISTTKKTESATTIPGKYARPQTLEPSGSVSATIHDSVTGALRTVERSIRSCWTAPSASERTLPPSPIITLPRDAIAVHHSPQRTPSMNVNSGSVTDPFILHFVRSSSSITDNADLSSSSDADSATPVAEAVSSAKAARNESAPVVVQPEQNEQQQQQNVVPISEPNHNHRNFPRQEISHKIEKKPSLAINTYGIPESAPTQTTSVVTSAINTTATAAMLPDPSGGAIAQPGVRRHVPSTKLISVSVWDTHDGDKGLRQARRLWSSEDKHTLEEISEIEEAHTGHDSILGKSSNSQTDESGLLQTNDDCVERVRASRSPVRPHAKQKPCQRRSLSLPSGGLSYGDVKILYKDGHFVMVDTSTDRASKATCETTGALDDVFEEAEGTDQSGNVYSQERNDDGDINSKNYLDDSRIDDAAKKALSFDSCDTGFCMRRFVSGGSIFYSLPRRKVRSQSSKGEDDAKMWRSQQSLVSQTEMERMRQKEEEETADSCRLGPGLRRNNSFTEAMGSTVILTDRDRKRNRKIRKHVDSLDDDDDDTNNSYQKEVGDEFRSRKSRSKGPGFIQRMLQKRKGTSSLSLSMSSLKPHNNDVSSSSLSLASSASSTSLQHTSPGRSDSRDSSVGRKISFRGFFKRKNSVDSSVKKGAASEDCSSPPLAAFLSNDDIGATVPSAYTHAYLNRGTRQGSYEDVVYARECESHTSYQFRPRSSTTHVSVSSSQCSVYRSRSHDESDRSPVAAQSDSASRRARSLSERAGHGGRILSEERLFSGESSSEFELSSPDPHNSDGTLTPRSTSPSAADLSGDQTLLASPALSHKPSQMTHQNLTSSPPRNRRTRSRHEDTFQRTFSAHGDSSLSILTQRTENGEIISSNSNDSGIQKDFSVNSSAESIQTATVKLRESHSPSPTVERPKSDTTVRWADWIEHAVQPWSVQRLEETSRHKLPRATSDIVDEDFNDNENNGSEIERNEDNLDKKNEVEESPEGGIYASEHRRSALLNARSLGSITNITATTAGVRSVSCCGATYSDARVQSRESLMNLVELRRPVRDAVSAKLAKLRRLSTPQPIAVRAEKPRAKPARVPRVSAVLMKSHSMPDNLDKLTRKKNYFSLIDSDSLSITSQQSICDNSSDESEYSMDYHAEKSLSTRSSHVMLATIDQMLGHENLTLAEALWDHVTMDPDELAFRAGDLISVTDGTDKHWWCGVLDGNEGWFPATFVRLRVNQDVVEEDLAFFLANDEARIISEAAIMSEHAGKAVTSTGYQGMQQARANVVNEIINAEREYVKHLRDVIEGYVKQARKRPEMFPIEKVTVIFSNIEDIYLFATELLAELDKSVIPDQPHLSELGHCFLDKVRKFEMYSDYCNNHSAACEELRELYRNKRYRHFFEACRLLQEMIEIPLEGFLLTPVQKICKYHLQLAELLKFTAPDHPDFYHVQAALEAMKKIAMLINERKRKMESVEKLAAWQMLVDGWEGPDILDDSSELIYSGEVNKINHAGWSQERYFFLFDHQLIYCKKDLLKKAGFCFKGRINMDTCEVINVADGREPQYNVTVRNAWKLHDSCNEKWYLLVAKTTVAKQRWLKAFQDERKRVKDDTENNFNIPYHVKQAVITNFKQKNTIHKPKGKGHLSRANTAEVISSINRVNAIATLPRTKNRHKVKSEGTLDTNKKMKWFFFGKGKT